MNRQMTDNEIIKKYQQANTVSEKREQIKIIAQLNSATEEEIIEILSNAGIKVPAKKKTKEKAEKKKEETKAEIPEAIRRMLSELMQDMTDQIDEKNREKADIVRNQIEKLNKEMEELEEQIIIIRDYLKENG